MTIRGISGLTTEAAASARVGEGGYNFTIINPTTAKPGIYRMCWCRPSMSARGCTVSDDYVADFGQLEVVAPAFNHLRQCYWGEKCLIDDLEGFGLEDGDVVHVLKYCPDEPRRDGAYVNRSLVPENVYVPDWPRQGLSLPAENEGRSVSWGGERVTTPIGVYQLCWCMSGPGSERCQFPQDFYVRIGEIVLAGPKLGQTFSVTAGHPAELVDMQGYGMKVGDAMTVVPYEENCSAPAEVLSVAASASGFPDGGILTAVMPPWPPTGSAAGGGNFSVDFSWGSSPIARSGGTFNLCKLPAQSGGADGESAFNGYIFLGCGDEAQARRSCSPRRLPMPKTEVAQLSLMKAVAAARAQGLQRSPCGDGIWLGGSWSSERERWEWDDTEWDKSTGSPISDGPVDSAENLAPASPSVRYMNWAGGQPSSAPDHEEEPALYMDVSTGLWHDSHTGRHRFGIVCEEAAPVPAGIITLDGPFGVQDFPARPGKALALQDLQGVGLRAGDLLLSAVGDLPCGRGSAVTLLGGVGISYPSPTGTDFSWPGKAHAEGGKYALCWCRIKENVTDCRQEEDFMVPAGVLVFEAPMLEQRRQCTSAKACNVHLDWPASVQAQQGSLLVAQGAVCGEDASLGFPGGPLQGDDAFEWPPLPATGGLRTLCWCSLPGCDKVEDHLHKVGTLEVLGPYAGHAFNCEASRACSAGPLTGVKLQDGHALLYTTRSSCISNGGIADAEDTLEHGVVSLPAKLCGEYFVGCTSTWPATDMAVALGVYRLCWCFSAQCEAEDFLVDVGTLTVTGEGGS
mmetsp:Transcript_130330/g.278497  ORF Transcript_130330/g.278497 Transcript_130330/m.278497 type:complete len:796 (+) Transcript_130330:1-2388(+)